MWETGVTVSSVSEAGFGLDCEVGLLCFNILQSLAGAVLTPIQFAYEKNKNNYRTELKC